MTVRLIKETFGFYRDKVNIKATHNFLSVSAHFSNPIINKVVVKGWVNFGRGDLDFITKDEYMNYIKDFMDIAVEKGVETGNAIIKSIENMIKYSGIDEIENSNIYNVLRDISDSIDGWIIYKKEEGAMGEKIMYACIRKFYRVKYKEPFYELAVEVYTDMSKIAVTCLDCDDNNSCRTSDNLCDIKVKYVIDPVSYILHCIKEELNEKEKSS